MVSLQLFSHHYQHFNTEANALKLTTVAEYHPEEVVLMEEAELRV